MTLYGTGAIHERDRRDYKVLWDDGNLIFFTPFGKFYLPSLIPSQDKFSWKKFCGPVREQGYRPTCVGFACAGLQEILDNIEDDYDLLQSYKLSPEFVYRWCKKQDRLKGDTGTTLRMGLKCLQKKGVCLEKTWPYGSDEIKPNRKDRLEIECLNHKIKKYALMPIRGKRAIPSLKSSIKNVGPIVSAVRTYKNWDYQDTFKKPSNPKDAQGLHCIIFTGWEGRYFQFKNSWGYGWGIDGYGYMHEDYYLKEVMASYCVWDEIKCKDVVTWRNLVKSTIIKFLERF